MKGWREGWRRDTDEPLTGFVEQQYRAQCAIHAVFDHLGDIVQDLLQVETLLHHFHDAAMPFEKSEKGRVADRGRCLRRHPVRTEQGRRKRVALVTFL